MSLIRKHGAVLQAWACLDLVVQCCFNFHRKSPSSDREILRQRLSTDQFSSVRMASSLQNVVQLIKCRNHARASFFS